MLLKFRSTLFAVLVLSILFTALPATPAQPETGFLNRIATIDGTQYRYQVYVPAEWSGDKSWPVIVFLHGAGERGEDGLIQTEVGLGGAIRRHSDRFPAVIVMPQCRKGVWWTDPKMEGQVLLAFNQTMKEFKGDHDRVYLTGISMGGYGTWAFAAKYTGRLAAIAPVCGGIKIPARAGQPTPPNPPEDSSVDLYAEAAKKIGITPVWVFHGGADPIVPVTESRKMVEALKAAGGNVKYTEYEGVAHNSWDNAYNEPDFATWLFAQHLNSEKTESK